MTAAALTPSIEYAEDGVSLAFAAPFRFLSSAHLAVERIAASGAVAVLALGADYSVTGGSTDAGGTVTLVASVAGARLRIRRVTPRSQQDDYTTGDTFPAESHEQALDRLTLIAQELAVDTAALAARAFLVPDGETGGVIDAAGDRADALFGFDGAGVAALYPVAGFKGDKGDAGGNVESVGLFTESWAGVPAGTHRVRSNGHTTVGLGAGDYVEDALATYALATAHPAFVKTVGARYFRLLPDPEGFITPEQGGTTRYVAGVNQRPSIQAALDYCKAAGAAGIKFTQANYELWTAAHVGSFTDYSDNTGNFFVIDEWPCSLLSTNPRGTTMMCFGQNGLNLLTDYQVIYSAIYGGDVIWRGAAVKLCASVSLALDPPAESAMSALYMDNVYFFTGITAAQSADWPCWPPSRAPGRENAWDISMKGVFCENDKHVGDITIIGRKGRAVFDGFLGEGIYCGGGLKTQQKLTLRSYFCKNTNGSAINPNGPRECDIIGLEAENCYGIIEGWGGWEKAYAVGVYGKNCTSVGEFKGGHNYDAPLRPDGGQPIFYVEGVFDNCGIFYLGSFCHGKLRIIDGYSTLAAQSPTMPVRGVNVDIEFQAHRGYISTAIILNGYVGAPNMIRDNYIRARCTRSKEAVDNGFRVTCLTQTSGPIGPRNYIDASGYFLFANPSGYTPTDNRVGIRDVGIEKDSSAFGADGTFDPTATPAPSMNNPFVNMATWAGAAGTYPVTLPTPSASPAWQEGAEGFLQHIDAGKPDHFAEVSSGGITLGLVGLGDRLWVRCNRRQDRFDRIEGPSPRKATASIDITNTAAGAESGPYTIAAKGCKPHHFAFVRPAALVAGFAVSAVRAETDQVTFWVRNIDGGAPLDPAAQNFTAEYGIRN